MQVIMHDGTGNAMQDARWCTSHTPSKAQLRFFFVHSKPKAQRPRSRTHAKLLLGKLLQARVHDRLRRCSHAQQARSTGKSDITDQNRPIRGRKQLWHTRPKQNAANQEIPAAQCRMTILTHLVGSRAGGCKARLSALDDTEEQERSPKGALRLTAGSSR